MTTPRIPHRRAIARRAATAAGLLLATACVSDRATAPAADVADAEVPSVSASIGTGVQEYVAGEVLVKFRAGASAASRAALMRGANAEVAERILTASMRGRGDNEGVHVLRTSAAVESAIAALRGRADVEYAEPNWVYHHEAVSNDPYVTNGTLWGMTGTFGSGASNAWVRNTSCSNVVIGIIDEGYMYTHSDLAGNVGTNPDEIAGNGKDDDANGLVDDVYGWDFAGNNSSVFDGVGDDHGTHVAGTIGGRGGNATGVAGVCWDVKLMSAKFLGATGGTTANAIKAVDYFTNLKNKGMNIVATNNSWGGGGFSQGLKDAIDRAGAAGILFVAAAGNSSADIDATISYPAGYDSGNIISVASITSTGALSSFSNYGLTRVDLGAPGSSITSTLPVSGGKRNSVTSGYGSYSGTSMATPHVTGAVAFYAARNPLATAAAIKSAILGAVTPTASLAGKTVTGGRLNISGF